MKKNKPDVMVLWHANPNPFSPPILSENQITGVLDEHIDQEFNCGHAKFTFPRGEFDLEELLNIKKIEKPDYLFVCLDSTTSYLPRNIENVSKNTFLCLGDTHHLPQPITRLIKYASSENFAAHIFTNNVRHAHWFHEVSKADQYFEPALFAIDLKSHLDNSKLIDFAKEMPVFYGQMGQFHPRRKRIMPNLIEANLVRHISGTQADLARHMQNSMACINVTLNSDLNSRVFEIAQTGCLQIIDELSISNGHGSVLIPGHNCLTFQNEGELNELLSDPNYLVDVGTVLGQNFKYEYDNHWGIDCIRDRFIRSVEDLSIKFLPLPKIQDELSSVSRIDSLDNRLFVYENFLEIHRNAEKVSVLIDSKYSIEYKNCLDDLPRLKSLEKDDFMNDIESIRYYVKDSDFGKPEIYIVN